METMERFRDLERSTDKYEYYENSYPGTRWWAGAALVSIHTSEVRVIGCVTKVVCRFTKICSHNSVLQIKKLSDLFINLHLQSRVVLCVADNHDSWVWRELLNHMGSLELTHLSHQGWWQLLLLQGCCPEWTQILGCNDKWTMDVWLCNINSTHTQI